MLNTWWVIFASNFTKKGGLAPLLICCLLLCVLKHGQGIINPFCSRRQASHSKKSEAIVVGFSKRDYLFFYFTWFTWPANIEIDFLSAWWQFGCQTLLQIMAVSILPITTSKRERKRGKGKGGKEKPNISVAAENSAFFKKYLFSLYFSVTEQESPFFSL